MALKAITFDLWDTVLDDGSDEPARTAAGLLPKPEVRLAIVLDTLSKYGDFSPDLVRTALGVADAAFYKVWQENSVTWTCRARLEVFLAGLGVQVEKGDLAAMADAMGRLEVDVPPALLPGVQNAIQDMASKYKLIVVSDTIFTPADGLRAILKHHGLYDCFDGFAFSDEVGRSKPHADMFEAARKQAGVDFDEMLHIGDRDNKDIAGAQALGMKAVLYTGKRDVDRFTTAADAVCEDHENLVGIVEAIGKK